MAFGLLYVLNHSEGLGAAHTTITYPYLHMVQPSAASWGGQWVHESSRRLAVLRQEGATRTVTAVGGGGSSCLASAVGLNRPAWLSCVWLAFSSFLSSASLASMWYWSRGGAPPMSRCRICGLGLRTPHVRLPRQLREEGLRVWGHGCPSCCTLATHGHCSHQRLEAWECSTSCKGRQG